MNPEPEPTSSIGDRTSRLAFRLWEQAGSPAGREEEFWLLAERQIRNVSQTRPAAAVPSAVLPTAAAEAAVRHTSSSASASQRG